VVLGTILVTTWVGKQSSAQSGCTPACTAENTPGTTPTTEAWAQEAHVTVNIDPSFLPEERQAIQQTFNNWSGAALSGVTFTFTSNAEPTSGQNSVQVNEQTPSNSAQAESSLLPGSSSLVIASFNINSQVTDTTALKHTVSHEIGHTFGLDECENCTAGSSAMNGYANMSDTTSGRDGPSCCDGERAMNNKGYNYVPPPSCAGPPSGCIEYDWEQCLCTQWDPWADCSEENPCTCGGTCMPNGTCTYTYECSPIIIAVGEGSSYQLTSPSGGVLFDMNGDGIPEKLSWTQRGDPVGFLVRDRNRNGIIDDGTELFGNHSILPSGESVANGFVALRFFDGAENGGNGDGKIDPADAVWAELKLWVDWNHDGVSQTEELFRMEDFQVWSISLEFSTIERTDAFGNHFRLKAACQIGPKIRQAYDVFFSSKPQRRPN